jgi:hypothetical protein
MTIKMHLSRSLVVVFLLNAGVVFAGEFQSKVITTSPLTITVPEDRFVRITNFTQEGGTDRGVARVNLSGDADGTANVLTATRIDLSTGINSQNFPEIGNEIIIAGPAAVRVPPVAGATLLIAYKKEPNQGDETNLIVTGSPTPAGTPAPSATPTAIPTVTPTPVPTLTPTPTPRPTRTPRPPP